MGSFADLTIGGYLVFSTKSYVCSEAMLIFDESDRYNSDPCDDDHVINFGYRTSAAVVRDRLDVMGFTLRASRDDFTEAVGNRARELSEAEWDIPSESRKLRILQHLTFERWLEAFRTLKRNNLQSWNRAESSASLLAADPDLFELMLDPDSEHTHGFPTSDFRYFLRAALESCQADELVDYDLSDVLGAGYYSVDSKVADGARDALVAGYPVNAPVVILTEGSRDSAALRLAMSVLTPHLRAYYAFLDFASASVRGGATALVEVVKAFIGARIANRVIAVFDNDTAAGDALRSLETHAVPPNIRIIRLPSIQLGTNYPTFGPSGPAHDDINGRAGALELYLGRDVLTRADGTLTPVQWRGYVDGVGCYQGEFLDKRELHVRYEAKARAALRDRSALTHQDWTGMESVLEALRSAFT